MDKSSDQLVRFAPPAISRHERAGHNWKVGIMEKWVIDEICLDRSVKKKP
jgi:hypothetical protein